jgi:hypothetical protein
VKKQNAWEGAVFVEFVFVIDIGQNEKKDKRVKPIRN